MYILFLLLIYYIGYKIGESHAIGRSSSQSENQLEHKNIIRQFLADFKSKNSSKNANATLHSIEKYLESWEIKPSQPPAEEQTGSELAEYIQHKRRTNTDAPKAVSHNTSVLTQPIDNTALLLYFGAFLFITSMGLFVGFSSVNGTVKTIAIAAVALLLYSGGLKLYKTKKRFKNVGAACTGIGLAIAPLIGLGAYNYIFDQSNAPFVWFATSVLVFSLYLHALVTLRNTIVSYLLICSFVSLFESSISVINAPLHYFAWGLAICGLLLQTVSIRMKNWPELKNSSFNSSFALIVANLAVSTFVIADHGIGQLCISLGLATLYSFVELYNRKFVSGSVFVSTHALALMTIGTTAYYATESAAGVAYVMAAVACLEAGIVWILKRQNELAEQFATTAVIAACISIAVSLTNGEALLASFCSILLLSGSSFIVQKRTDMFYLASIAWMAIPIIYGQIVSSTRFSVQSQAITTLLAITPNAWFLLYCISKKLHTSWVSAAETMLIVGMAVVSVVSFFGDSRLLVGIAMLLCSLSALIAEQTKLRNWVTVAGLFPMIALTACGLLNESSGMFLTATIFAFTANTLFSLFFKETATRWFSTIAALLTPLALGIAHVPNATNWQPAAYAWAYVVVMIMLALFRSVARGKLLLVRWATIESLTSNSSTAYLYGSFLAGIIAVGLSYSSAHVALHSSLIAAIVGLSFTLILFHIEGQSDGGLLLPITAQVVLFNAFRIYFDPQHVETYIAMSLTFSLSGYVLRVTDRLTPFIDAASRSSLLALYLPAIVFVLFGLPNNVFIPISFLLAGLCTLHYVWKYSQAHRESAGSIILAGIFWLMFYGGVRNIQAYSHLMAFLFVLYAFWRHSKNNLAAELQYIYAALITTTVPLVWQALSSTKGGLYGIWLLVEMILIMIVGMTLRNRLATRWGLYTSVGAVLYQLRDLGWAMLAVLALFVIGIAVYRTNKETKDKN